MRANGISFCFAPGPRFGGRGGMRRAKNSSFTVLFPGTSRESSFVVFADWNTLRGRLPSARNDHGAVPREPSEGGAGRVRGGGCCWTAEDCVRGGLRAVSSFGKNGSSFCATRFQFGPGSHGGEARGGNPAKERNPGPF